MEEGKEEIEMGTKIIFARDIHTFLKVIKVLEEVRVLCCFNIESRVG